MLLALGRPAAEVAAVVTRVQNELFDLGADLATPVVDDPEYPPLRITQDYIDRVEADCDRFNEGLTTLDSFILPGGTPAAALLHQARTVARRAERSAWALRDGRSGRQQPAGRHLPEPTVGPAVHPVPGGQSRWRREVGAGRRAPPGLAAVLIQPIPVNCPRVRRGPGEPPGRRRPLHRRCRVTTARSDATVIATGAGFGSSSPCISCTSDFRIRSDRPTPARRLGQPLGAEQDHHDPDHDQPVPPRKSTHCPNLLALDISSRAGRLGRPHSPGGSGPVGARLGQAQHPFVEKLGRPEGVARCWHATRNELGDARTHRATDRPDLLGWPDRPSGRVPGRHRLQPGPQPGERLLRHRQLQLLRRPSVHRTITESTGSRSSSVPTAGRDPPARVRVRRQPPGDQRQRGERPEQVELAILGSGRHRGSSPDRRSRGRSASRGRCRRSGSAPTGGPSTARS